MREKSTNISIKALLFTMIKMMVQHRRTNSLEALNLNISDLISTNLLVFVSPFFDNFRLCNILLRLIWLLDFSDLFEDIGLGHILRSGPAILFLSMFYFYTNI